ncbi:MAG: hypothetical protein GYA57_21250 [Myxococcales bacterium]|nr:hypothetical protein [Myxococcales bacterium]
MIRRVPWVRCWWGIAFAWQAACGSSGDDADRSEAADPAEDVGTRDDSTLQDGGDGVDDRSDDAGTDVAAPDGFEASPDVPEDEAGGPGDGGDGADGAVRTGCLAAAGLSPYWGNFHAHTSFSDGEGRPSEAFAYARNVAGLDVLIVTDHLEQIYLPTRWADCKEQADAADAPGAFVADCGYEYGSGFDSFFRSTGHNNVFHNPDLFPAVQLDFHDFYASLVGCPSCVGQFNHPGDEPMQHWNHFEYDAAVDERMQLYEFNSPPAWEMYFEALDAGWHVSPMWNQDNHSANWGTANDHRSGLWLAALTRDGVYAAFGARRTFATADRNAWVRVLADGDCWMGSDLAGVGPSVELSVEAEDGDATDAFDTVELWGPGRTRLDAADCGGAASCAVSFEVPVGGPTYVVARVNQVDGEWLVAAPVWLAP